MKKLFLALVGVSLFLTSYAQCSLIEVPLQQRVTAATLTVEGRVVSVNSFWNTNHSMIYTSNIIEVYKVFKGSVATSTIEILTEGGTVGLDRISLEPNLVLSPDEIGIFTCGPVIRAHHIAQSRSSVPSFETFASSQGFIKYNLEGQTASDPFRTYQNIETTLYPAVLSPTMSQYQELVPFNINGNSHRNGNPQQLAAPVISSFSPTTITAGTGSVLTINGSNFGASAGSVGFLNSNDGGSTYITALPTQILTWSNTQITVEVPSDAGTGTIQVTQAGTGTSATSLTISYAHLNVTYNPGSGNKDYQTDHVNDNGTGGYTWQMNTAFDAATTERASFMRAFSTWTCSTGINWTIGATTSINSATSDGTNCICNDNTAPLSSGVLGVCYSYWQGCASGPNIVWYVNELDIIFDDGSNLTSLGCTWQYGPSLPSISQYDFETVCVHELGHGHQLGHVISNGAIMHWAISNGASNRSLGVNDLAGGNYVQAKSEVANACGPGAMSHLSCGAAPVADFSGTPTALCAGGTVAFTDLSTNTPTSWSWVFQGGTPSTSTSQNPTITYNTAGTYSVTLTATNGSGSDGQSYSGYITVYQNPTASVLSQTNIACNSGSNGAASVSVSGGTPAYTYNWTPGNPTGDGTASVTGLTAGTWTCTVSDSHTCSSAQTFNITQPTALVASALSQTNISCNGGSTGAASVTVSGGTTAYSYNWTPGNPTGDGTASVTGLAAGTWTCTVTDANSCTTIRTFNITQPSALVASALSQTNISCNGGSNGAASVSVSGGTTAYSYNWTPGNPTGDGTASVTGLTFGSWTCTVTDANSCTTTQTFNITQPSALVLTAASQTNIACNGGTGAASVNAATGGAGSYTYNWTPGNPTGDGTVSVTGLTAGTWTCTVTDANSCATTQSFNITQPTALVASALSQTNISCNGGANGAASVTVSGGTTAYSYNWTPGNPAGDGTASVTGLTAGTWTCTVTDANSCTTTQTFNITQPSALVASALSQTNISCNGGSNGAAMVSVSGGTTAYSYNWTPGNPTGDGTASVTGLTSGSWTCTVTDANSCTTTQTFNITQPSALVASAASQTNISCNGGSNGAASVSVSGGTTAYSYNWTPGNPTGDGTPNVSGLSVGSWTCTVTDANSCTTTQTFNITQPSAITASISSTPTACSGNTGTATVSAVSGGAGSYTYSWAPSGGTATTASSLSAGNYTCTITDANTCSITKTVTVANTGGPSLTAASQTNINCNGNSNGAASVNAATGGVGPYTYNWTPGNPTGDGTVSVTGLTAGSWTCTVTDANTCIASQIFNITQPSALVVSSSSQINISCFGSNNGSATVVVSGGSLPYTYSWTDPAGNPIPGQISSTATGLSAGTNVCHITDANNCFIQQSFIITQPTLLVASASSQTNISCNGGSNGAASVNVSGGTTAYSYNWTPGNPTGDGTASVTGLTAGTWTCTVTDANSCSTTQSFTITTPSAISSSNSFTNVSCALNDGTASVSASGGTPGYTYSWSPSGGTAATATGLTQGSYTCTITDANSCTSPQTIVVGNSCAGSPPVANFSGSQTSFCVGGTVNFTDLSSNTPTSWAWTFTGGTPSSSTSQNPSIVYNTPGTYAVSLTATNAFGSGPLTMSGYIHVNGNPSASAVITNVTCNGSGNGAINLTPSGGTGPYTFAWSPSGQTTEDRSALTPATYSVTVTDANGCTNQTSYVVTQPTLINATMSSVSESCTGNCDGTATVVASGGTAPYTYAWSPSGGTAATATSRCAGNYTCTVTDANGCTRTGTVTVGTNNCAGTTQLVQNYTNQVMSNWIYVTAVAGATNYEYQFSIGATVVSTVQRGNNSPYLPLSTAAIGYNNTYNVKVRAFVGSVWGSFGAIRTVAMQSTIPLTQLTTASCGATNLTLGDNINVIGVAGATNYEYKFTDLSTAAVFNYVRGSNSMYVTLTWVTNINYGHAYSVAVRSLVGGVWSSYGALCNITMQSTIPTTSLTATYCNGSVAGTSSTVSCNYVYGATDYYYKFTDLSTSVVSASARGNSNTSIPLNWANPLLIANHSYSVVVSSLVRGTWSSFGPACTLAIGGARMADPGTDLSVPFTAILYPNPIVSDVTPTLNITGADGKVAVVKVVDLTGKEIIGYQLNVEGNEFSSSLNEFPSLPKGMYFMTVTVDDKVQNLKFVVE